MLKTLPRTTGLYLFATSYFGQVAANGFIRTTVKTFALFVMGAIVWCWRAHTFVHWLVSRKASTTLQQERNAQCDDCEVLETMDDGRRFCKGCGCPKTKWSELTTKNGRQGHNCPMGTHRGSRQIGRVPGCKGCGKAKTAKSAAEFSI